MGMGAWLRAVVALVLRLTRRRGPDTAETTAANGSGPADAVDAGGGERRGNVYPLW